MKLKIKRLHPDAVMPKYATDGAACFDLHAVDCGNQHPVYSGMGHTFRTGLSFEIAPGHVMLIYSRSGHGFKNDTRLANAVAVIDADYRGEVMVRLTRDGGSSYVLRVNHGDRIAQAMIMELPYVHFEEVEELSETARGTGGFGSTGT